MSHEACAAIGGCPDQRACALGGCYAVTVVPKRAAALVAIQKIVDAYVADYEFENGEGGYHEPSEEERTLISDAIAGLHADDEFVKAWDAWRALCTPLPVYSSQEKT